MKFITENELRTRYSKEPFESFILSDSFKLTPGARQFLNDFRIRTVSENNISEVVKTPVKSTGYDSEVLLKKLAVMIKRAADKTYGLDKSISLALNELAIKIYIGKQLEEIEVSSDFDFSESFIVVNPGDSWLDSILDFIEIELMINEVKSEHESVKKLSSDSEEIKHSQSLNGCLDSIKSHLLSILNGLVKTECRK